MILIENLVMVAITVTVLLFYFINKRYKLRARFKNIQNKSFSYIPIFLLLSTILAYCYNGNQLITTIFSMLTLFCFLIVLA